MRIARLVSALVVFGVSGPSAAWAADGTPPTAPTNLRVTGTTSFSVSLAWNPSTDNSGSFVYRIRHSWGYEATSPDANKFHLGDQRGAPQQPIPSSSTPSMRRGTSPRAATRSAPGCPRTRSRPRRPWSPSPTWGRPTSRSPGPLRTTGLSSSTGSTGTALPSSRGPRAPRPSSPCSRRRRPIPSPSAPGTTGSTGRGRARPSPRPRRRAIPTTSPRPPRPRTSAARTMGARSRSGGASPPTTWTRSGSSSTGSS